MLAIWMLFVALLQPAHADEMEPWQKTGWGFGGLPAANYNSDDGFGFGAIGDIYRYNGEVAPYRTRISFLVFLTTKQVHTHRIDVDALQLAGGKLRVTTRAELNVVRTVNFCGYGPEVSCDPTVAEQAAAEAGLEPDTEEWETFTRRYYKARFLRPNGYANFRWKLTEDPALVELMGGWRAALLIPGDFGEQGPYPGSLYATLHPEGEQGFLSVLFGGIMYDTRDNEPSPRSGAWLEASVRGGTRLWGSSWEHMGLNATARGYVPLAPEGRLTLAMRGVVDTLIGDVPIVELSKMGGYRTIDFYGGEYAGRGIRWARFLGKVKLLAQPELRWAFARFRAGPAWELMVVGFADMGWMAEDLSQLDQLLAAPMLGTGGGIRIAMNQNFIVRVDGGFSPIEDYSMGLYINVGQIF